MTALDFPKPWLAETHYVYELYATDGCCLYVGCTINIGQRFSQHLAQRPWWPEVTEIKASTHASQEAGRNAERELIQRLNPLHNRVHTDHPTVAARREQVKQGSAA